MRLPRRPRHRHAHGDCGAHRHAAHAALADCPNTSMCIWANNDFGAALDSRKSGLAVILPVSTRLDNKMDSWRNDSPSYDSCGYDGHGSGDTQEWKASSQDNNVSVLNSDEVSSWRTLGGC